MEHQGSHFVVTFLNNSSVREPQLVVVSHMADVNITVSTPRLAGYDVITQQVGKETVSTITLSAAITLTGQRIENKGNAYIGQLKSGLIQADHYILLGMVEDESEQYILYEGV